MNEFDDALKSLKDWKNPDPDYWKCKCHPDWGPDGGGIHRTPIDCNPHSKAKFKRLVAGEVKARRTERKGRLSRKYESWEDEFDDKMSCESAVGGWWDSRDDLDVAKVKEFIKRCLTP